MIEDHVATFLSRLTTPFQGKATFTSLATIVGKYCNQLEQVFADIRASRDISTAVGVSLDTIGKIVGQPRGTAPDDATYALYLAARVLTNKSQGTVNQLSRITKTITGATTAWVQEYLPNQLVVHVLSIAVTAQARGVLVAMMHDAKLDAVGVNVHTNTYPPASAFTFAGGAGGGFGVGHLSSEYKA